MYKRQQQEYGGRKYFCTLSAGYAGYPEDGSNYLELLKSANYSLEYSKMMGKNRMTVFSRDILADRERRLELMELLRESVERGFAGFTIHYQPQVDTLSGRLCGAEALARWHCSKYGDVSPGEFIPLMEPVSYTHLDVYKRQVQGLLLLPMQTLLMKRF